MKKIWNIPTQMDESDSFKLIKDSLKVYADALSEETYGDMIGEVENSIDLNNFELSIKFTINIPTLNHKHTILFFEKCNKYPFYIDEKDGSHKINSLTEVIKFMDGYVQSKKSSDILSTYFHLIKTNKTK